LIFVLDNTTGWPQSKRQFYRLIINYWLCSDRI